jgi:uncharacterized protein (DUF1501 family)
VTNTLIVVSLRGGADGLNMLVPYCEDAYYDARPTIGLPPPGGDGTAARDLDGRFALHPALARLGPLFDDGRLAFVHAVGWPGDSHSHFEVTDEIEAGVPGTARPQSGWLARCLARREAEDRPTLRTIAFAATPPRLLAGEVGAITTMKLERTLVSNDPVQDSRIRQALHALYRRDEVLGPTAIRTLDVWESVRASLADMDALDRAARYPRTRFGSHFSSVEALLRAGVGLEAASLELSGWDTHVLQGGIEGGMAERLNELAEALDSFATSDAKLLERSTVVVLTEFGRRVRENGGAGTDHGCGSVMILLGNHVRGGRVYGEWPGIAPENLTENGDLVATTDMREVLSEVVAAVFGAKAPERAFPDFGPRRHLGCAA